MWLHANVWDKVGYCPDTMFQILTAFRHRFVESVLEESQGLRFARVLE